MTDLFWYNSGSLLQALAPEQTLVDLSGESFMDAVTDTFKAGVTAGDGVYGVPVGNAMGGGVLYNKKVYDAARPRGPDDVGRVHREQRGDQGRRASTRSSRRYGADSTWTSQLFVLGDFYNVEAAEPGWAEKFTANEAHFADTPAALRGLRPPAGGVRGRATSTRTSASATYADGAREARDRRRARTTRCSRSRSARSQNNFPDNLQDVGFFAIPGDDADNAGMTTWLSAALYLPQSSEHEEAAKEFLAFVASPRAATRRPRRSA